jgi:CheY-like chemotaxis protein
MTLLVDVFDDAGFEPLQAFGGRSAVEYLRTRADIRAVLTDIRLPDADGYEGAGKVTGDEKLKNEGVVDQVKGKVQNVVGGIKDAIKGK